MHMETARSLSGELTVSLTISLTVCRVAEKTRCFFTADELLHCLHRMKNGENRKDFDKVN